MMIVELELVGLSIPILLGVLPLPPSYLYCCHIGRMGGSVVPRRFIFHFKLEINEDLTSDNGKKNAVK